MLFSQRKGLKPAIKALQIDDVDSELRNRLWSCYFEILLKKFKGPDYDNHDHSSEVIGSNLEQVFVGIWSSYFKKATDTMPNDFDDLVKLIRKYFFQCPWNEVYDFIELTVSQVATPIADRLRQCFNTMLEQENSGYRVVGSQVAEITNEQELRTLTEAMSTPVSGANRHIEAAIRFLSDRKEPDYRNSIKESISAVEAICLTVAHDSKASFGTALAILQTKLGMHGALKSAFASLYGYSSDEHGIRHAMIDEPQLSFSDAKFMLIACSAFVTFVVGKTAEAGIDI